MKRAFFVLLLFASPTLHAALRGMVFATGGEAVENARVAVYRRESILDEHERVAVGRAREVVAQTTSNAEGAFTIEAQGVVDLEVTRDGYAPWKQSILAEGDELAVELVPAPGRGGRVTAGGKPVAGAIVIADDGLHVKWSTRTDDKGAFTIPDPARWAVMLRVLHPDHAMLLVQAAKSTLELVLVPGVSVSGKVVGANRRPVANAKLFAGGWPAGTTREDGTFTIAHLPGDVTTIFALAGEEHGSARRSAAEITITLEASKAISGVVRDPKDRPLAGARVFAWPKAQGISWDDARAAITDEKGNYRVEACDAKDYQVVADAADFEFESAVTTLRSTRMARLDFTAKLRNYLTGTVVDARKKPVAGARVQLTTADAPLAYAFSDAFGIGTTTAADGRFRLPIAPQLVEYSRGVQVRVQAIHPQYAAARAEVKLGGSLPPMTITLPDGIEVRGTVKDKDGKAVSGAGVLLLQDPSGTAPFPLDALLTSGRGRAVFESDAEGKFTLHLNDAPHGLSVWKEGFAPFRLAEMTPAAGQKPIEVVLERGVEIRGRIAVKSGSVPAGGMLIADFGGAYVTGTIAADQSFVVPALTPGLYTLRYMSENGRFSAEKTVKAPATDVVIELPATGEIRGRVIDKATNVVLPHFSIRTSSRGDFNSEDFDGAETFALPAALGSVSVTASADGYVPETQQVTVDEKKPATVTFALTRGRTISGRVTTEAGDPVAEAQVSIETDDSSTEPSATSTQDGEFEITGARREPVTLSIKKQGFIERKVEVEGETDRRLNLVLSTGRKAVGRVVTASGEPVADAQVWAFSTTPKGESQQTKSSADGSFALTGLSEGRYSFQATRSDLGKAELDDVDPSAAPLVITFPASKGAGTIHGTVKGFTEGGWTYGSVSIGPGAQGAIRRDGTYRVENVAAGEVEVRAYAMNGRDQITSAPVKATVVADQDVEVNLAFRGDIVIRGTVTEGGQPAIGRNVGFSSGGTMSRTKTDEHGVYELKALEPGNYQVDVETSQRQTYTTRYQVARSATFDIAVNFAQINGRAVDEAGAPQAGVSVEVKSSDAESGETVTTDAAGTFTANVNEGTHYVVTATKKGFATAVQQVHNTRSPVVLTLTRSAGLRVRLTDARDGRTLAGYVVATNAAGLIAARAEDPEKDGSYPVPLASGAYRVSVSANGYASQSVRVTVPSQGEVRLALTPGGNLIVRTEKALGDLVKLVMTNGEEYVRCQCNGIAEIRLTGTTTTIDHVAPGRYTMQVLDAEGRIKTSYPVTIEEGGTTVAEIHLPD